jgi:hypothetical protein
MPAQKPVTTPLPVPLSAPEVNQCLLAHLSRPRRGPTGTLGSPRVFTRIWSGLDTGRPWTCWPVPTAREGTADIHDPPVDNVCAKGAEDGSMEPALVARVGPRSEHHPLDLSRRQGDGTHTVANTGGEGLGSSGHQHQQGETVSASIDHHGSGRAPLPVAPVKAADTVWWPAGWQAWQRVARLTGVGRTGASRNGAGGFASRPHRQAIFQAALMPHMPENPRHRNTTTRGRTRVCNDAMPA